MVSRHIERARRRALAAECEAAGLLSRLLISLSICNDALGTSVRLGADLGHVVVGPHVVRDVELVVSVSFLRVVVGTSRLGFRSRVVVRGTVFGMSIINVLVAEEFVEFVLGSRHIEKKRETEANGAGAGKVFV